MSQSPRRNKCLFFKLTAAWPQVMQPTGLQLDSGATWCNSVGVACASPTSDWVCSNLYTCTVPFAKAMPRYAALSTIQGDHVMLDTHGIVGFIVAINSMGSHDDTRQIVISSLLLPTARNAQYESACQLYRFPTKKLL